MRLIRKEKGSDGTRYIKFIKWNLLTYKRKPKKKGFIHNYGKDNIIDIPSKCSIQITIHGNNNKITVSKNLSINSVITITIHGNNNVVNIGEIYGKIHAIIGERKDLPISGCSCSVGDFSSIADTMNICLLENSSHFSCGTDCMFSYGIIVRCSDGHTVLSLDNKILNKATAVKIGDHVWVGQDVLISKNTEIPDGCIVGARAVVTKKFKQKNCVLAGVPAKVVKENIRWERTPPDKFEPAGK